MMKTATHATRTKYLLGLIVYSKIPVNHKGLAPAIETFNRWVFLFRVVPLNVTIVIIGAVITS